MTNGDDIQTGNVEGTDITIGKEIRRITGNNIEITGNTFIFINNHPSLKNTISNLSKDNVIEAANNFNEALQKPDVAKKFEEAAEKFDVVVKRNREQQKIINEIKEGPFARPPSSIDPFADPLKSTSANEDMDLVLLRIYSRLHRDLKRELLTLVMEKDRGETLTSSGMPILKNESMNKSTKSDMLDLQIQQTRSKLEELNHNISKILKAKADSINGILRNI